MTKPLPILMAVVGVAALVGAQQPTEPVARKADRLLVGGVVHTADGPAEIGLAILDGRVEALVPEDEQKQWRQPGTLVVNLRGAHVLPGLIDAHLHLAGYGTALEQVDLTGSTSWQEVVRRARTSAGRLPPGAWVEGRGWDQNLWPEKSFPDRAELDAAIPDRPVLLRRVDGHAAVANARALQLAGIDGDTPDPDGGRIVRRDDGEPTGVLVDNAVDLVRATIPDPSEADVERRIMRSASALARLGLTQVHDAGTTATELAILRRLAAKNRLPIRVWVLLDGTDASLLESEFQRGPQTDEAAMLRVGAVKLYADGALGSRGALLGADYADDPGNRGLAVSSSKQLLDVTRRASAVGFQVGVHAIGDEGVHQTLGVFKAVGAKTCRRLRHRIEHSQTVRPADVATFKKLGAIAAVQPTHCTSDMPWAPDRLGPDRISWAYRWRSFVDAGVALAGGSDAPVEDPDPRRGLFAAVTRQQPSGLPADGWNPAERLTRAEAVHLFTSWAAFSAHAEGWCGTIEPGNVADLTIVDADPLTCPAEQLLHLNVLRTVVHGSDRHVAVKALGYGGTP